MSKYKSMAKWYKRMYRVVAEQRDEARAWARKFKAELDALGTQQCTNCVNWDKDSETCIEQINSKHVLYTSGYGYIENARDPESFWCSEWEGWE